MEAEQDARGDREEGDEAPTVQEGFHSASRPRKTADLRRGSKIGRRAGEGGFGTYPPPAPEAGTPAMRPPRRMSSGKYADLTKPTGDGTP